MTTCFVVMLTIAPLSAHASFIFKEGSNVKAIMAVFLLLVSPPLLADRPDCSLTPGGCVGNQPGLAIGRSAAVPEPGALALIGLGMAGLVVARRRKK
jgi:hypothetical protein